LRAGGRFLSARPGLLVLLIASLAAAWALFSGGTTPVLAQPGWTSHTSPPAIGQPALTPPMVPVTDPAPAPGRRITVLSRGDVAFQAEWRRDPPGSDQWIAVIDQGVNVFIEGLQNVGAVAGMGRIGVEPGELSLVDISTDRLVIWARGIDVPDLTGQTPFPENVPLEIYMEGNIVFREGERIVYADRMYYDVNNRIGIVLDAELLTPVPNYEGLLRLKSEVLQQVGQDRFYAHGSFITSSRMGRPGYRLQTSDAYLEDNQRPAVDPYLGPLLDPVTGEPIIEHQRLATARNDVLFLGEVPVFYWPYLATNLEQPSFYLRRARFKNDNVFGTQALTDWDAFQLLGIRHPPEGVDWGISFDYLSERGFGHGTTVPYSRPDFLGIPGPASGLFDFWGIQDDGVDNLGRERRSIEPEKHYRWRLFERHRQMLPGDLQLSAEVGWISDRNFLEEYFEREWDEMKDETTGLELKRARDNRSWSITADYRVNDFFTQTDWLPRADHFWLGQPLFDDLLTWYEHTSIGYARFNTLRPPDDPAPGFSYLPWEVDPVGNPLSLSGERVATRQEIDLPIQLGPVKLVPYALGEAAHWGEDRSGNDLDRLYGQTGVRASLPIWKVNRDVQSDLWNLNGLAHKVVFDVDFSWSDASQDLGDLPLYDPLDDDSIEAFRRRFTTTTFGGAVPLRFDERYYALRSGLGDWVTSPSTEIADDLLAVRMGVRQRWQTKRGMPGEERIVDWITFDTQGVLFPDDARDDFGQALGLVGYDFRWHVGDRLTVLSQGGFDFFDEGQRVITVGGFLERPPRGSLYAGIHLLEGPFSNSVLSMSYSYRMSEKWVTSLATAVDLGNQGNIGQHFSFTRIGESLLISGGINVDASRGSVGVNLAIEPRFLPRTRLGRAGGARIPPAGSHGLE
jgi:hypothetical protein